MDRNLQGIYEKYGSIIDLTFLDPCLTEAETVAGCILAGKFQVAGVVVKPCFVFQAVSVLEKMPINVGTVIGYPHGSQITSVKVAEANRALTEGACELEMVINVGYLKGGQTANFMEDIKAVCGLAHMNGALFNLYLQAEMLSDHEIKQSSQWAVEIGVDTLITSTTFFANELLLNTIDKIISAAGSNLEIKANGVFQTASDIKASRDMGSNRVGLKLDGNDLKYMIFDGSQTQK